MRHFIAIAVTSVCLSLLMVTHGFAIKRVETSNLSCGAIQNIMANEGAVILRYPSQRIANYTLYDRYVANERFCRFGETVESKTVPAKDTLRCRVLICSKELPIFDRLFND